MDQRITGVREIRLELLRPYGALRGVGRVESRNDGGAPPRPDAPSAISMTQAQALARGHAAAIDTHPGAQGTAANPPRGAGRVDVRV